MGRTLTVVILTCFEELCQAQQLFGGVMESTKSVRYTRPYLWWDSIFPFGYQDQIYIWTVWFTPCNKNTHLHVTVLGNSEAFSIQ